MARIVLLLALVAGVAIVVATSAALPASVATHFGTGGRAGGFMTRSGYEVFYCSLLVFMVAIAYASLAWLPARFPRMLNLPNRDYWLDGDRAGAALAVLRAFGAALALLIVVFLVTIHLLVVEANARTPPTLHEPTLVVAVAAFVALLLALIAAMFARFRVAR